MRRVHNMKTIKMQPYQVKAIEAIQKALNYRQHHIIVEMATGSGKGIVLTKTLEFLNSISQNNILVVTDRMEIKKFVEQRIINENKNFDKNDRCRILVTTEQRVLRNSEQNREEYQFVVFYETNVPEEIYKMLNCVEKTVIVISADYKNKFNSLFKPEDVVFYIAMKTRLKTEFLLQRWIHVLLDQLLKHSANNCWSSLDIFRIMIFPASKIAGGI